jgi:GrpB-like predicted nucleotidyltransferase (UPF0157 family)
LLVIEYNPEWVTHFQQIHKKLLDALNGIPVHIEHVGSTAVPGLSAKAIIDIDIVYHEAVFEPIKSELQLIGYYHNGDQGLAGREVFKRSGKGYDEVLDHISHHLYVCRFDSAQLQRHILFRDYLIKHPALRDVYSNMKHQIAMEANNDQKVYAALKELQARAFIDEIIDAAKAEQEKKDNSE